MSDQTKEDLSRPTVEVRIPQVKLTLQDLGYLRSLAQDGPKCYIASAKLEKLRFLDLVAKATLPPTADAVKEVSREKAALIKEATDAIRKGEWQVAERALYTVRQREKSLEPKIEDVLTEKGKALLRNGEVKVRARKVGCV